MNCQKASNLLSAYLDRELTVEERRLLRLHLLTCNICGDELQELEGIKLALGRLSVTQAPPVLAWLRMQITVESAPEEQNLIWQYPWFRRTCAIAALLLLFGLSSALIMPQRQNNASQTTPAGTTNLPGAFPGTSWASVERIFSPFANR